MIGITRVIRCKKRWIYQVYWYLIRKKVVIIQEKGRFQVWQRKLSSMAPTKSIKLLLLFGITICISIDSAVSIDTDYFQEKDKCICEPQKSEFNQSISGKTYVDCPQCYKFTYDFSKNQVCLQFYYLKVMSIKYN